MTNKQSRAYFEDGCLCILTKRIRKCADGVADNVAVNYYEANCKCTRHWDSGKVDLALDAEMRKEWLSNL